MRNKTFTIMSCIGIILIVLGHLNWGILEFWGLFPYYSYHVMIFVFISGYFYKEDDINDIWGFLKRKFKRLIIPYMIINLIVGIIVTILHHLGFSYGYELGVYNLLVAPFENGHQFMLNAPGWFIPALFLMEVCNVAGRKILSLVRINNEYIIFGLYILIGIAVVILSKRGSVYDWYRIPGRVMFMAPVFQLGRLYKAKLEGYDKVPSVLYFGVLLILNLILKKTQAGLAFSAAWVNGFANNPLIPFVTIAVGIALWLRVSKLLAGLLEKKKIFGVVDYMGKNTYAICMFHLMVSLAVSTVYFAVNSCFGIFSDFDKGLYFSDVYYAYAPGGVNVFKIIYLLCCIFVPLGFCKIWDRMKIVIKELMNKGN